MGEKTKKKLKKKFLLNRETKWIFISAQTNFAMPVDIRLSSITKIMKCMKTLLVKKKTFILWCQQICKEFTELHGMTSGNFTFTNSIFLALY